MGFFSSRKAEDNDIITTISTNANNSDKDKSVVQVIRSRFYGKQKGKGRDEQAASFKPHAVSAAQTLSSSIPTTHHAPLASSPLAGASFIVAGPSKPRSQHGRSRPTTPSKSVTIPGASSTMPPPLSPEQNRSGSSPSSHKTSKSTAASPRKPTDTVTMTLAQRLNELAAANSEGLLNDDEYRLLRQNLFERFASSATVPTETPVVPVARPRPRGNGPVLDRPTSRPLSNFTVETSRPPSIQSKSSITSGVSNIFRRATGRRTASSSTDHSDATSLFSTTSSTSRFRLPRVLSKKSSTSSVRTAGSRSQADAVSISSRRTGVGSDRTHSDHMSHFSPSGSRSAAASIRRLATPPSSFPARTIGTETRYTSNVHNVFDEDYLTTSKEIKDEILSVEAEARRLMDAFHGLEVTTMSRIQRSQGRTAPEEGGIESTWTMVPDGQSQRRITIIESDAVSMKSATSAGTSPSMSRSAYSQRKVVRAKSSLNASLALGSNSRPGSLHRKNSTSSVTSGSDWRGVKGTAAPPVPALPTAYGHLGIGASASNLSLTRSTGHLPMAAVPEDACSKSVGGTTVVVDVEELEREREMEDIRRRREEVNIRYEARLDYLRAKLKGAQLHEKLLKK